MALTKFFNKAKTEIEAFASNNPPIRATIKRLIDQLDYEEGAGRKSLPPDVLNAVQQLKSQLQSSVDKFDREFKKGIKVLQFNHRVREMAEECRSAIYSWEPTLTAAPGFWNKLKAYVNAFLEECFGLESYFQTEKNKLGLKDGMSTVLSDSKHELTQEVFTVSENEDICSLGF